MSVILYMLDPPVEGVVCHPLTGSLSGTPSLPASGLNISVKCVDDLEEAKMIASRALSVGFCDPAVWLLLPNGFAVGKLSATDAMLFDIWREEVAKAGMDLQGEQP